MKHGDHEGEDKEESDIDPEAEEPEDQRRWAEETLETYGDEPICQESLIALVTDTRRNRNMYFPFFTCEVKCGATALDIADRQNAHSMTLAVRGIVTLFTLAKRQQELHRKVLAFSVSHDHRCVRIYGHYPHIGESETTYYRHLISEFSLIASDGEKKWTTCQFTKNIYKKWLPTHLAKIRSAIDDIPDFQDSPLPEGSGLSQSMESHRLSQSLNETGSLGEGQGSHLDVIDAADLTPDTSFSAAQGTFKKPKKISKTKR